MSSYKLFGKNKYLFLYNQRQAAFIANSEKKNNVVVVERTRRLD